MEEVYKDLKKAFPTGRDKKPCLKKTVLIYPDNSMFLLACPNMFLAAKS